MTTTIDLFDFTKPATKQRMLTDERVYDALATEIYKALEHDASDEYNETYIEVKVDDYTASIEIHFDAEWHKDMMVIDGRSYDLGDWQTTRLTSIAQLEAYKTYEMADGDEVYIDMDLDINKLNNMINY